MKSFGDRVYETVRKIPRGKIAAYGQIARLAGKPRAARAVGFFMRTNPSAENCPCHRVVGSDGALVGYAFRGISEKRKKLIDEGVSFLPSTRSGQAGAKVNLEKSLWKK